MADLVAWKELIERLRAKSAAIFQDYAVLLTDACPRELRVVALTLLNRTLSAVEAASVVHTWSEQELRDLKVAADRLREARG
jgi:hypothetical protein